MTFFMRKHKKSERFGALGWGNRRKGNVVPTEKAFLAWYTSAPNNHESIFEWPTQIIQITKGIPSTLSSCTPKGALHVTLWPYHPSTIMHPLRKDWFSEDIYLSWENPHGADQVRYLAICLMIEDGGAPPQLFCSLGTTPNYTPET